MERNAGPLICIGRINGPDTYRDGKGFDLIGLFWGENVQWCAKNVSFSPKENVS